MNFDVRQYRRRVQRWRQVYAGLSESIRVLKQRVALAGTANNSRDQAALQRALTVLQDEARVLLDERQQMKDYWHAYNSPQYTELVLGVVFFS